MKFTLRHFTLFFSLFTFCLSSIVEAQETTVSKKQNEENQDNISQKATTVITKVTGINIAQIKDNVSIYINEINPEEADGSERYQDLVRQAIYKGIRVFGYYDYQVEFTLEPAKNNNNPILTAQVKLGKPTLIEQVDVHIQGAANNDPEFQQLLSILPKKGDILNHEVYTDYKSTLQKLAVQRGYFDADFTVHRLEVMPSTYQAWWRLLFESGERYRYGEIRFQNSQIRADYLQNILSIKTGQEYLLNDVLKVNNDYSSSGWFQSALMKPTLNQQTKTIDFDILFQPKKKNAMEVGIGYSSDVGPRLQLGWRKPWINSRGHSFSSNFYISSPKQTVEMQYKMPLLANPLYEYYQFSLGLENEKDSKIDTKSTASTLGALRYWEYPSGWQYSVGLRSRYDKFTQAGLSTKTLLVYPTASISHKYMEGGAFPTWAHSLNLNIDLGRKIWASDVDFISLRVSTAVIKTLFDNHRIVSRLDLGWLKTKQLEQMPPAMRFFAGGDRSVRGYGYKKISPKDNNGQLIGASRLATASFEYQYQVYSNWWLATFYDFGLAANSYKPTELRHGTGIGVRWASPIGAIKFDLATPIRDKDNSKNIQFYIGLGAEI